MTTDLHLLAAAFALDALDPDERRAFEAHYPTCEQCNQEVIDFREAAVHLAGAAEVQAPAAIRDRVLADIGVIRQLPPVVESNVVKLAPRWSKPSVLLTAVAAAVVLIVGLAVALRPASSPSEIERVFNAPDAVLTDLEGGDGDVQVLWSATEDRAVVFANGLDDLPVTQEYALWLVTDEGVTPAGLFRPDDGRVREALAVADIDPTGWGITIEPAGGSPQPTTDIIYLAEF